ncbi:ACBP-domain-containing protein [Phellopilus nigrolimitatus]|nr:ACBP-domain-containing protein [Phellopilus nigrolimitatus]
MDSRELIDAQFDRAVQIVQGLPKTGPIQTGYEEKLAMYSLYKQATVGNVKGTRPAMWDMLGRAKWDAWAKHKDLDSYEAKWFYVDELLRVLRKYSDKTIAQDLVKELEAYGGDPSNIMLSGSFSKTHESDSDSDSDAPSPSQRRMSQSLQNLQQQQREQQGQGSDEEGSQSEDEEDDQLGTGLHGQPVAAESSLKSESSRAPSKLAINTTISDALGLAYHQSQQQFYPQQMQQSAVYVQPQSIPHIRGVPGMSTSSSVTVPAVQPMPNYETPSAFPGPSPPVSSPGALPSTSGTSAFTNISASGASGFTDVVLPYPASMYPGHTAYRVPSSRKSHNQSQGQIAGSGFTGSRSPLERAVENVQAHLTALQERMEMLESRSLGGTPYASRASLGGSGVQRGPAHGSPFSSYFGAGGRGRGGEGSLWSWLWDISEADFGWENMGLWSVALAPLARLTKFLARVLAFLLARRSGEGGGRVGLSPALVVLRRLLLDASFVLVALFAGRKAWQRSGVRRREVLHALAGVWGAVVGRSPDVTRHLVDRGV